MTAAGPELTITAIVPTFNRREQLLRCLAALGAQSLPANRYDIVVIDDGSTDGSAEAVEKLTLASPVVCSAQANLGPAAARNRGISIAGGDLLLFLGDDVIADRRLLEEHVIAHQRHPGRGSAILGRGPMAGGSPPPRPWWPASASWISWFVPGGSWHKSYSPTTRHSCPR